MLLRPGGRTEYFPQPHSHRTGELSHGSDARGLPDHEIGTMMAPRFVVAQPGLCQGASAKQIREDDRVLKRLASTWPRLGVVAGMASPNRVTRPAPQTGRAGRSTTSFRKIAFSSVASTKDRNGTRQLLTHSIGSPRLPRGPRGGPTLSSRREHSHDLTNSLSPLTARWKRGIILGRNDPQLGGSHGEATSKDENS